jgi:predicted acetyltransferase
MLELVAPTVRLHRAWFEAHAEWGPGAHEDGFGLTASDEVTTEAGFSAWVARLVAQGEPITPSASAIPRCTYRWIVQDDEVLGAIALRHGESEYVRWAGHLGYGIRPSARGRGLAAWAMRQMLVVARELGLDRVLVVCAVDNEASIATIEGCGGLFEAVAATPFGPVRRYWIELDAAACPNRV